MNVLVVGGGRVGSHLAALLHSGGHRVRVVEKEEGGGREIPPDRLVRGSGTDPMVLTAAGVRAADVVAAVTGDDATNLVVTSLARFEFGVRRTIARVKDPRNAWMFGPEMGVDVALSQADLLAHLVAEEMSLGDMMTLLKLRRGEYSLVEEKVHPGAKAAGAALSDLALPPECVLLAVLREGALLLPEPGVSLRPADEVIALVRAERAKELADLLGPG